MADIKGLGNCGICGTELQDPKTGVSGPVRHFSGHQLAHKGCMDKWSADDQRLMRARETVARLNGQIAAMTTDRDAAQAVIDELAAKLSPTS
jgi:hypothetical protein